MKKDNNTYNKHRVGMLHDLVQISEKERKERGGEDGRKREGREEGRKEGKDRKT